MLKSIRVDWRDGSDFLRSVRARIARDALRYRSNDDPLEPFSEVWAGLHDVFSDGQILRGEQIGLMLIITDRRVANYYRSKGARPIEQPSLSHFDQDVIENIKSALASPDQTAIHQEICRLIQTKMSEIPAHWADAIRAYYGFPGAPEWIEFDRVSGTSRQNLEKRVRRARKRLELMLLDSH